MILCKQGVYQSFSTDWTLKWVPAVTRYCKTLKRKDIKDAVKKYGEGMSSVILHELLCAMLVLRTCYILYWYVLFWGVLCTVLTCWCMSVLCWCAGVTYTVLVFLCCVYCAGFAYRYTVLVFLLCIYCAGVMYCASVLCAVLVLCTVLVLYWFCGVAYTVLVLCTVHDVVLCTACTSCVGFAYSVL